MIKENGARYLEEPIVRSAPQILYGSAFPNRRTRVGTHEDSRRIDVYQGASDFFLGPGEDLVIVEGLDLDFEVELAVILDAVPQGITVCESEQYVRMLTACNDFTYRKLSELDRASGFGFVQSKPLTSFFCRGIKLDAYKDVWNEGRPLLELDIMLNKALFCTMSTDDMLFGFPELISHCARTRALPFGTIITSGSISSCVHKSLSRGCIAEYRSAVSGQCEMPFLAYGDEVSLEFFKKGDLHDSEFSLFGRLFNRMIGL